MKNIKDDVVKYMNYINEKKIIIIDIINEKDNILEGIKNKIIILDNNNIVYNSDISIEDNIKEIELIRDELNSYIDMFDIKSNQYR